MSRVKHINSLSNSFECQLRVRQGACLSHFLFSMFINDFENMFVERGVKGIDVNMFKLFLTLYADNIVLLANSIQHLQNSLDLLFEYNNKWNLCQCF